MCKCGQPLDGAKGMCRACKRAYNKLHYQNNKQYYVDKAIRNQEAARQRIRDLKESQPCMDCKKFYPYYVMDFDHRENKLFEINYGAAGRAWATVQEEIAKCDLVCANCHRIRTHMRL